MLNITNVEESTGLVSMKELSEYTQASLVSEKHMLATRKFISLHGSQLSLDGEPFKKNEIIAIILDHVIEQTFYLENYDPQNAVLPACFSFGRTEAELAPHALSTTPIHAKCLTCPNYQWGSKVVNGQKTAGKACQSRRRLALIYAGDFENDQFKPVDKEMMVGSQVVYLRLPVTAINTFAKYVKNVATVSKRPPFGVYTRISLGRNFDLTFNTVDEVPLEHLRPLINMHNVVKEEIMFPYDDKRENNTPNEEMVETPPSPSKTSKVVKDYNSVGASNTTYQHKF